jgi:signal transduction histidine kinase
MATEVVSTESVFDILRSILAFKDVPDADLEWMMSHAEVREFNTGDYVFKKGEPIEYCSVVLTGKYSVRLLQEGEWREYTTNDRGTITGALPYSRLKEAGGYGFVLEKSTILMLHRNHFQEMAQKSYPLTQALVSAMLDRTREFTSFMQQNEKLISLGKLSAGLAHELNNPAAAIVRSAAQLKKHLQETPESFKRLMLVKMNPDDVDALNTILFSRLDKSKHPPLSLMARTELQDELRDWFDAHQLVCGDESFNVERAEIFAEYRFTIADLEKIASLYSGAELVTVVEWIESVLNTEEFVSDIHEASSRIKKLVESVKGYSNMDRPNDRESVDLTAGLTSTLTILNFKLKQKHIQVKKNFPELPLRAMGYIGEINQVFTNIIDNAIDALPEKGVLELVLKAEGGFAKANIIDNGSGIPEAILNKIFDPFFTTKPVGQGTGLGLDIVRKIMEHHKGEIRVKSKPGRTEFELCFPMA